jgi:hypothetical protein
MAVPTRKTAVPIRLNFINFIIQDFALSRHGLSWVCLSISPSPAYIRIKGQIKSLWKLLKQQKEQLDYDSKELLLNTTSKFEKKEASAVWSNNTCLVRLAEAVSYSVWETADD